MPIFLFDRKIKRYGYYDHVKREGPMPRMANDSAPIPKKVAVERDDWAEEQVMAGQNDYIDILGSDDLHPTDLMYNVPEYLKGGHRRDKHFMLAQRRRKALEGTPYPETFPQKWYTWKYMVRYFCHVIFHL